MWFFQYLHSFGAFPHSRRQSRSAQQKDARGEVLIRIVETPGELGHRLAFPLALGKE